MKLPFGKYKGIHIDFVNSGYLKWLCDQDWFMDKFPEELNTVEEELNRRDYEDGHFYEDKVHI